MTLLSSGQSDERIPASAVDDLLRAVRVGLDQLEVDLQQANLDIVECEARLAGVVDLRGDDHRVTAVRSALETAAVGAQEHLGKALAAAHAHGAARLAAAEAEACWIVQGAREDVVRDLVGSLRLAEPVALPEEPVVLPKGPSHAELTTWSTPPAEELARRLAELDAAPAVVPPAPPVPPEPGANTSPDATDDDGPTDPQLAAELAFWSEAAEADSRGGGVDLALTAVSALLVLAILTILLLWIG